MAISDGIVPGTVPYGSREQFASALDTAGQGSNAPAAPAATSGAAGIGGPLDPLQAMLTGGIPASSAPVTSGLSVGPGASPASTPGAGDSIQERLLYIANNAKNPNLRIQARAALRTLNFEKKQ